MKQRKNKFNISVVAACIMGLISACSSNIADEQAKAAILSESSSSNIEALSQAMSLALNGKKVSLLANAFLKHSQHTLERKSMSGINTNSADGLMLGIPDVDRFTLVKIGSSCHLVYEKTGKKYPLTGVKCIAL